MAESKLPISLKGIVFRNNGTHSEVLLLRNDRLEWELPGGRIERGETPEECVAREFKEETGLSVSVGSCILNGRLTIRPPHVSRTKNVWISTYGCHLRDGASVPSHILLSNEHKESTWIRVSDLAGMTDIPDLYKAAIVKWRRELDIRPPDPPSTPPSPHCITHEQLYLYDLLGFMVIRSALDTKHVNALRSSVRHQFALSGRETANLLDISFDHDWGSDWADLIDHPSVLPILLHIFAGKPKLDHGFTIRSTFGNQQGRLHHQGCGTRGEGLFHDVDTGKISNGLIGIIYSLYDNDDRSGGFCCIPGSHKSN